MKKIVPTVLFFSLLISPAMAAKSQQPSPVKKAATKPRIQAHYSLIDGKPIQRQVVQQSILSPTMTCKPEPESNTLTSFSPAPIAPALREARSLPVEHRHPKTQLFKIPHFSHSSILFNRTRIKERSWVSGINQPQAQTIASEIADFMATQFTPENTTLTLAKPLHRQRNNPLTKELETSLRSKGFALSPSQAQNPNSNVIRYKVNLIGDEHNVSDVLLRLSYGTSDVTRLFFKSDTGVISGSSPFSIRNREAETSK